MKLQGVGIIEILLLEFCISVAREILIFFLQSTQKYLAYNQIKLPRIKLWFKLYQQEISLYTN